MLNNYQIIKNEYYEIFIPNKFIDFGNKTLEYSTNKIKEYLSFFNEKTYGFKIKASFMLNHEDFIQRINDIQSTPQKALPPDWARGCFYGGECQILLDDNPYKMFTTLAHESFHLLFTKFIYQKNNFSRIIWLDESLAVNFDGTTEKSIITGNFDLIVSNLLNNDYLPKMNDLSFDKNNIITENYNGYDLFAIVGRYLIETKKETLLEYINNYNQVIKDGDTILQDSLKYFSNRNIKL
jgi:hypothetical protein